MIQNGFVECEQENCPSVDDCYMLERKNGCCEKCKGKCCQFSNLGIFIGKKFKGMQRYANNNRRSQIIANIANIYKYS